MVKSIDNLEESIRIAVDSLFGATASRVGPFISDYISLEDLEFLLTNASVSTIKYCPVWIHVSRSPMTSTSGSRSGLLKEVGVLEEVTAEVLAPDPSADRDEFDKRYYDTTGEVDMSWLEEDVQSIALTLAGRDGSSGLFEAIGQPSPASIPSEILNPQQMYYGQNNPDSAYLEG